MKTNPSDTSEKRAIAGFEALTTIEGNTRLRMKAAAAPAPSERQPTTARMTSARKRPKTEAAIAVALGTMAVYLLVGCFRTFSNHLEVVRGRGFETNSAATTARTNTQTNAPYFSGGR